MNRNRFYFAVFLLVMILIYFLNPVLIGDLSHVISLGNLTLENRQLVSVDPFTYTDPEKNFFYPLISSFVYSALYKIGGLELAVAVSGLIGCLWIYIWYLQLKKYSLTQHNGEIELWNYKTLTIFLVAALGSSLMYVPRPALIASIYVILGYIFIIKTREKAYDLKYFLYAFVFGIVWVNTHGSFPLFLLMLGFSGLFYLIEKNFKFLTDRILLGFCFLSGVFVNQHGYKIYKYVYDTATLSPKRGLNEWFSPFEFDYPFATSLFLICSAILIYQTYINRKKLNALYFTDPFILIWLLSFSAVRNIVFFFFLLPIFFFRTEYFKIEFARSENDSSKISKRINVTIVLILALLTIMISPHFKKHISHYLPTYFQDTFNKASRSEAVNRYLAGNTDRIFNTWDYGSDLSLVQNGRYFIDTRNIIFSDEIEKLYENFILHPDTHWTRIAAFKPKYFYIHAKHGHVINWLKSRSDCRLVVEDHPAYLWECDLKSQNETQL